MIKIIRTEADYQAALEEIERLIEVDPEPDTDEFERFEVLKLLIKDYEKKNFLFDSPDPIEAILFRMEQQGLSQRDLMPYLGNRSRVSEILSGKRQLTLPMLRALHSGLGIPSSILLKEPSSYVQGEENIEWHRFPLREMLKRGWIKATGGEAEDLLRTFFKPIGSPMSLSALYRSADHVRSSRTMDKYALAAWTARVIFVASENPPSNSYQPNTVDLNFMQKVARLSTQECGPQLAQNFLWDHGISLVIEPHLPQTYLDGAAILVAGGRPVIGLSIRYDRIDNFWFVLMHELAHVSLHLDREPVQFYDDLDSETIDPRELEADDLADEALIPKNVWNKSPAKILPSPPAAEQLAKQLGIHPAVVAGRIRYLKKSYRILPQMVGQGEVQVCFPKITWQYK